MFPSHYKVHLEFDQSILACLPPDGHSLATGQMYIATGWVLFATGQIHTATGQIHTAARRDRKYTELNWWLSG